MSNNKPTLTIHLIANAHIDPVWLWDWREGFNEGIQTCRTVLDLMDENPRLTFVRGESMIYQHIEQYDPITFERIRKQVEAGRWDVVGGTAIQPDHLIPTTEALIRQFVVGQNYFKRAFGKPVRAAWSADSFGHSAGLPEIFEAAGIDSFAFTRPNATCMPLESPAFWWEGASGCRVLTYRPLTGMYYSDRTGLGRDLDATVEKSASVPLRTIGFFYGMGNHGGNPAREIQVQIEEWAAAHPEIEVVHSGLHAFFDALRVEVQETGVALPVVRGELGLTPRGGFSAMARFKHAYLKAEARLLRAERTAAVAQAALGRKGLLLDGAWDDLLFNAFHDILPGTSIERAMNEQMSWLGSVDLDAQRAESDHLLSLAGQIDTTVLPVEGEHPTGVPLLVWNPHPHPFRGHIEVEACVDYRGVPAYSNRREELPVHILDGQGQPLPQQEILPEHTFFVSSYPWRKRFVVPLELPAMGWNVLEYAWVEGSQPPAVTSLLKADEAAGVIENGFYRVEAKPGGEGVFIEHQGRSLFHGKPLTAGLFEDDWGAWGSLFDHPDSLGMNSLTEAWKIVRTRLVEQGPERVALWVQFAGERSRLELTISLCRDREVVDVRARLFWDERHARLKLIFPFGERAVFDTPGGTVERPCLGEVPGGRWVRVLEGEQTLGFASDCLINFDIKDGAFRATVVRASGYSAGDKSPGWDEPWLPVSDSGAYQFQFLLQPGNAHLPRLAAELVQPPIVAQVPAAPGPLPRQGSMMTLTPDSVRLLALLPSADGQGAILRVQSEKSVLPRLVWMGQDMELGELPAGKIVTWKIAKARETWRAQAVDLTER